MEVEVGVELGKIWIHHSKLISTSWSYREHLRKRSSNNTSACLCSCIWDFLNPVYCLCWTSVQSCPYPHSENDTSPILSQIFQTCNSVKLRWIQSFCRKKIPFYYFCWKLRILTKDCYELNRSYYLGKNWKLIKILIRLFVVRGSRLTSIPLFATLLDIKQ